jgi:murein DD-endopeptidase MepM/ murein hydrolase activator NlpD
MKKFYYFSKSQLKFVELKGIKYGIYSVIMLIILAISYLLYENYSPNNFSSLPADNKKVKDVLTDIINKYEKLNSDLEKIVKNNNDLRIATNLPQLTDEQRTAGIGGGSFNNELDFLKLKDKEDFASVYKLVSEIKRKIEFEKSNYSEINNAFNNNKTLFRSIPAIKPCTGTMSEHSFGMRMHPILGYIKMHNGVDIVTNIGTPVHVTADGVISFVGIKGGFGLVIEVSHDYGYKTVYGHLSGVNVTEGKKVIRGDVIAYTGNSGLSSGPHLHYEVLHDGINYNPAEYFFDDAGI